MSKKTDDPARWSERNGVNIYCKPRTLHGRSTILFPIIQPPKITTAEEKFIRNYRDRWDKYLLATGEKRALGVVDSLTNALVEGGVHP